MLTDLHLMICVEPGLKLQVCNEIILLVIADIDHPIHIVQARPFLEVKLYTYDSKLKQMHKEGRGWKVTSHLVVRKRHRSHVATIKL